MKAAATIAAGLVALLWAVVFLSGCPRWTYESDGWCKTNAGLLAKTDRANCAALQIAEDEALRAHIMAGIDYNVGALRNVTLEIAPGSDGGAFPPSPEQAALGYTEVYGDSAGAWCGKHGPILLASFRWGGPRPPPLCHELAHIRRCVPGDDGPTGAFAMMGLDRYCAR